MKRFIAMITVFFAFLVITVNAYALEKPFVVDEAGLLSASQKEQLASLIERESEENQIHYVVLTVNSIGSKTPMEYADDYYDYNGYGYGVSKDGVLLLLNMGERDWYISTTGLCNSRLSNSEIQYIGNGILSYLSNGKYYEAFTEFVKLTNDYMTRDGNGDEGDFDDGTVKVKIRGLKPSNFAVPAGVGFVVALVVVLIFKSQLKSVRQKPFAREYIVQNSFELRKKQDLFLYSNVSKTRRETSSSSSGGGSSHRSSSGSSHGGGGGKF